MTEKVGGSDVANGTETIAIKVREDIYKLYGYKWFSSASDSDMTLTLARIADEKGNTMEGSKGLSLFFLKTRLHEGDEKLNGIQMTRLKEKLGTRQLPTSELLLDGTVANKISEEGKGISKISSMLQITRLHNSVSSAASMRRIVDLSTKYSMIRTVFRKLLHQHPLHTRTLFNMDLETRASLLIIFETGKLLGKHDTNNLTSSESILLRLLNPLVKLYTAKQAVAVTSEGLECFGGQGYMEDTGLPLILRDAQVLPIWEGTTNVLSMDVLRVLSQTNLEALDVFIESIREKTCRAKGDFKSISDNVLRILNGMKEKVGENHLELLVGGRDFSYALAEAYITACFIDIATCEKSNKFDGVLVKRWYDEHNIERYNKNQTNELYSSKSVQEDTELLFPL